MFNFKLYSSNDVVIFRYYNLTINVVKDRRREKEGGRQCLNCRGVKGFWLSESIELIYGCQSKLNQIYGSQRLSTSLGAF